MEMVNLVLKEIKPSKKEEIETKKLVDIILKKINKNIKDAKAILGGSGAKGTWLRGQYDVDIFVRFNYNKFKDKSGKLSDILEKALKKSFKVTRLHGSRDYFQINQGGYTFEIVPILDIKKAGQAKNITDVSPLHAIWVKKHKKFIDDMRLTKQFCRVNDVYGAESYIKGFSGYICEILTIYYKGFMNLVKNAAKWPARVIIDPQGYYRGKNIEVELNKSKLVSPLVIIDPVQADRNAAAALSKKKFDEFKEVCKKFVKKPSKEFFVKKEFLINDLIKKKKNNKLLVIELRVPSGKTDIIGCKLLKKFELINNELIKNDFKVDSGWHWDKKNKAIFYFFSDKEILKREKEREGPPLKAKEHVNNFKKKHKRTFVKNKRIYTIIKRKFLKPEELIRKLGYKVKIK